VIPVLIDCDPGQDDALALLLALASPELDVLGISAVAGNQTLDKTTANALRVLELAGRSDIPVAAGADRPLVGDLVVAADAHGESGLDGVDLPPASKGPVADHAKDFLAAQTAASDQPVTLVALGPLTNVALLLEAHPEAAAKVEHIVLMGGAIHEGNQTASAEFNIWIDPEAAARVFESGLDVTMVGLDVTNKAVLSSADADSLRGAGPVAEAAADMVDFYLGFYNEAYDHGGTACGSRHLRRDLPRPHRCGYPTAESAARSERPRARGHRRRRLPEAPRGSPPRLRANFDLGAASDPSRGTERVDYGRGMSYKRAFRAKPKAAPLAEGDRPNG
jgi:inosine-uridine nucleoside N-ribohydrolase